jgi:catechol 2,3-dioxygenase-like lactoylglutathione lyase family enzyme
MPVTHIDHYNIRVPSDEIESLARFYSEALGLTVGERPPFRSTGRWLYAAGQPLLHLTVFDGEGAAPEHTGRFSHIALKCEDFIEAVGRLDACGVRYEVEEVPLLGQRQIFFTDPAGVGVELNFDSLS